MNFKCLMQRGISETLEQLTEWSERDFITEN